MNESAESVGLGTFALAAGALAVCLVCVLATLLATVSSVNDVEVERRHRLATEVMALDNANRLLMRDLLAASARGASDVAKGSLVSVWNAFRASLGPVCDKIDGDAPEFARVAAICARRDALAEQLTPQFEAFDRDGRAISRAGMQELLGVRDVVNAASIDMAREADGLVEGLVHDYRGALLILTFSSLGFLTAGVILVFLVARTSIMNLVQLRNANRATELLRETLAALPAGIVVYDRNERLTMFNRVAAIITPHLQRADAIGRTYEELARETAAHMEAQGLGPQPVEEWVEQFRSKRRHRTRRADDGRWYDWSETGTPSGQTVGLRVDVTDITNARAEYAALVDSLADVVFKADPVEGSFLFVSAAADEIFCVAAKSMVGAAVIDFVAAEDRDLVRDAVREQLRRRDHTVRVLQCRVLGRDGSYRHVEVRYRNAASDGSRPILSGVISDIEQRVQLAQELDRRMAELNDARSRYQSLVDSLVDVAYTLDVESGRFTFMSASAAEFFGVPPEQVVGRHFLEVTAPDSHDYVQRTTNRELVPNDKGALHRFRMIAKDGEPRHVEVRSRRRTDEGGRVISTGLIRDIEERVQLERKLEQERLRLRSVVESSGALIVLLDDKLDVTMVNSGFTAMTGIGEDRAVGRPVQQVLDCPLDDAVMQSWRTFPLDAQPTEAVQFAVKVTGPDGKHRLVSVTATPVAGNSGRMASVVLVGVDETGRREAEAVLHTVERFATVGEMAAMMAHEISQPLQVINIAAAAAVDEIAYPADEQKGPAIEFLEARLGRITQQVEAASRIVGDFRAFVRGANTPENVGVFDPGRCIDNAVALTSYGLQQAGIELHVERPDDLPKLAGEPGRLEQVLVNLVNNARDAGGRAIFIRCDTVSQENKSLVRLRVDDSGPGIAADVLPRLFVAFVTTKAQGKGTGLGLRICKRIVEEMGGSITAGNRAEGGARLEVLLPVAG